MWQKISIAEIKKEIEFKVIDGIWILMRERGMKISSFVYVDERRIFSNTDIGCKTNCQYLQAAEAREEKEENAIQQKERYCDGIVAARN